ncbi:hypothetical protein GEMRC1_012042 [Eukaryota sp. GEM-RC1]
MLKKNNKLLVLNLSSIPLSSSQFNTILRELENTSILRRVSFVLSLDLSGLISCFKAMFNAKLISLNIVKAYSIDVSLGFIRCQSEVCCTDLISLLNALKSNIPIKRVECRGLSSLSLNGLITIYEILSIDKSVISLDVSPHLIDIENGVFCFCPEKSTKITAEELSSLKSFLECFTIKELTLKGCRLSVEAFQDLCYSIKVNTSLTSVDFSYFDLYTSIPFHYPEIAVHLSELINSLKSYSHLKSINLSHKSIGFNHLMTIFEMISTGNLTPNVRVFPHSIDVSVGLIRYENEIKLEDLFLLLKALNSNIPIIRVECRGLKSPNLKGLIVLIEILFINKSVLDFDVSPHSIDIENGVFCFSPREFTQITTKEISSLKSLLKCYNIKELTLKRCRFSLKQFKFFDFSYFELYGQRSIDDVNYFLRQSPSVDDFSLLINSLQSHTNLRTINLSHKSFGFDNLLTIYELISTGNLTPNIKVFPHSIDVSLGLIRFVNEIQHTHLNSLLKALNSNIPIKRVECRELKSPNLEGLILLFETLFINKSVLDLDISPHLIDVENGVFVFLHKSLLK